MVKVISPKLQIFSFYQTYPLDPSYVIPTLSSLIPLIFTNLPLPSLLHIILNNNNNLNNAIYIIIIIINPNKI